MKRERKLIGTVGVDSGQIMIMDPCYVESLWRTSKEGNITGLKFWGSGQEEAAEYAKSLGHEVKEVNGAYFATETDLAQLNTLAHNLAAHAHSHKKVVVSSVWTDGTYHQICDATGGEQQAGPLPYPLGHAGFLTAATSGLGDGHYNVYATYVESKLIGNRIQKVEIEFLDEDTLKKIEESEKVANAESVE